MCFVRERDLLKDVIIIGYIIHNLKKRIWVTLLWIGVLFSGKTFCEFFFQKLKLSYLRVDEKGTSISLRGSEDKYPGIFSCQEVSISPSPMEDIGNSEGEGMFKRQILNFG